MDVHRQWGPGRGCSSSYPNPNPNPNPNPDPNPDPNPHLARLQDLFSRSGSASVPLRDEVRRRQPSTAREVPDSRPSPRPLTPTPTPTPTPTSDPVPVPVPAPAQALASLEAEARHPCYLVITPCY